MSVSVRTCQSSCDSVTQQISRPVTQLSRRISQLSLLSFCLCPTCLKIFGLCLIIHSQSLQSCCPTCLGQFGWIWSKLIQFFLILSNLAQFIDDLSLTCIGMDKLNLIFSMFFFLSCREYCNANALKPLSTADFGKVMKQVYPQVRPRRLGTRGNSRYCYAGLKKRLKLEEPSTPECGGGKPIKGGYF